jgi:hypothetical protein
LYRVVFGITAKESRPASVELMSRCWRAADQFEPPRPDGSSLAPNATASANVCFSGQTGKHLLDLSLTGFDPDADMCPIRLATNDLDARGAGRAAWSALPS